MKKIINKIKKYWNWYIISIFKPYWISIVQEMILNQNFLNKHGNQWMAGRIEVYLDGPYNEFEIRFFTNKKSFYEKIYNKDFKNYSKKGIEKLKILIKENYCHPPK